MKKLKPAIQKYDNGDHRESASAQIVKMVDYLQECIKVISKFCNLMMSNMVNKSALSSKDLQKLCIETENYVNNVTKYSFNIYTITFVSRKLQGLVARLVLKENDDKQLHKTRPGGFSTFKHYYGPGALQNYVKLARRNRSENLSS